MAEYTFDKHMMAGQRIDIAKAFNGEELKEPFAVVVGDDFFTEKGLCEESGLIEDWTIYVYTSNPKKSFVSAYVVAYHGEGLKTDELGVGDFATEDGLIMGDYYSYFPEITALRFEDYGGKLVDLYYINSKGDYVTDGEKFTFTEDTESFTITWQDDIPGDKGEIVTGFVVRTTPHIDKR